jgi:nucleoside-diphosphate-sugar epimerase
MRVLLTGAFGNVGQSTLEVLLTKGYFVRCFDLKNPRNLKVERKMKKLGQFETIWGDIRDQDLCSKLVKDVDVIIHLAAIIPPLAYEVPELAYAVNVGGATNILRAAESRKTPPKLIYASSIAVHGNRMGFEPPTKITDPMIPLDYDNYAIHKMEMEEKIVNSNIPWTILRFAAITPFELGWNIPDIMYEIPLKQRIEVADTRDVGLACANAVEVDTVGKILFIGGGKGNQLYQLDYVSKMLEALGIGMLPEEAFKQPKSIDDYYHCDWMNTDEAQKLLKFQRHTFDDFLSVFKKKISFRRFLVKLFKPTVRGILLSKSPYYKEQRKKRNRYGSKGKPSFG